MTQTSATIDRCPDCGSRTARWLDYFCIDCGQHHDAFYLAEAPDPRPRSREQIAREYCAVGMTERADRLTDLPTAPSTTERPAPLTEPTAFVQRSLLDLLESA